MITRWILPLAASLTLAACASASGEDSSSGAQAVSAALETFDGTLEQRSAEVGSGSVTLNGIRTDDGWFRVALTEDDGYRAAARAKITGFRRDEVLHPTESLICPEFHKAYFCVGSDPDWECEPARREWLAANCPTAGFVR